MATSGTDLTKRGPTEAADDNDDDDDISERSRMQSETDRNRKDEGTSAQLAAAKPGDPERRLGRCASIRLFVVNYSFLVLFYLAQIIYNIGVIRTIERKFGLSSAQSGLILSMNDIAHVLFVVFVGYFGKKTHKPRFLSVTLLLCALSDLLMASPYMMFDDEVAPSTGNTSRLREPNYCDPNRSNYLTMGDVLQTKSTNTAAYYTMLLAQFLTGIGGSGMSTLGISYIDENTASHMSAMYIGIVTSMAALSPITSLGMAALFLKIPENPGEPTELKPGDPQWIGCWWLGYVVFSIGLTVTCVPMWFFPKHILSVPQTEKQITERKDSVKGHLRDFPKELRSLMKNKPFMVYVVMAVLYMYVVVGIFSNLPRYIEVHFMKSASFASAFAIIGAVAAVSGSLFSGYIMKRKKLPPNQAAKIVVISAAIMCLCAVVKMVLPCPQIPIAGQWQQDGRFTVETACNSNCSCPTNRKSYQPVCGEDQLTYFSPCHAGCRSEVNGTYTECSCVKPVTNTGMVQMGKCPVVCNTFLIFIITGFFFSLAASVSRTPGIIVVFRVVGDEQKPFALGIISFMSNLFGSMLAPLLFGALIDSTCIVWENTAEGTGSCLLYNTRNFRFAIYGPSLTFNVLAFCCALAIFCLIKKDFVVRDEIKKSDKMEREAPFEEKLPLNDD